MSRHGSLNRVYRIVWNAAKGVWQAVCETGKAHGKQTSFVRLARRSAALGGIALTGAALAAPAVDELPTGGTVVAGSAAISSSGASMAINQSSTRAAIDWQTFNIGAAASVNFQQPAGGVALNRVLDTNASQIYGKLIANGQVFLVNPNGVLFAPGAQVDVGGLVASTQNIGNADFMAGNYVFEGSSSNAIINQGNITAAPGGTIALIAAKITNAGTLTAQGGNVLLGAGSKVTLDMGGPVKLEVENDTLETFIQNGGAIKADGGVVYLTSQAANTLASSVINNTGLIEAQTLATGEKGEIVLYAHDGTADVAGTLDASAPNGGDGGHIETSGATVNVTGAGVDASSAGGKGGDWLLDPYNYTIDASAASTIATSLNNNTSVTISTATNSGAGAGSSGNGDITVNAAITKSSGGGEATLTLQAANTIVINNPITSTSGKLDVTLLADNDSGVHDGVGVTMLNSGIGTNGGDLTFGNGATMAVNGVTTMVGGDVYFGGSSAQSITTNGGKVTVNGEAIIANPAGLNIITSGGNVVFAGLLNSGDTYTFVSDTTDDWVTAYTAAQGSTGGAAAVGDTYLATITSRLENAVASYDANYQASWLGGRRGVTTGTATTTGTITGATWRWVAGPEGAADGGQGLAFWSGASGGSSVNGGYGNWNSGEPNNSGSNENVIQFVGTAGQWNDLPPTGSTVLGYVQETNLAASPLTINTGGGSVTFGGMVGGLKALASLTVTANGGIAINGGGVTTEGVQTYNNNVTLGAAATVLTQTNADTDFTQTGYSITNATNGDASLTIKTTGAIILEAGSEISSSAGKLDTVLNADSDATNGGYIWLGQGNILGAPTQTTILTNGGSLTLSGGSDVTTGYAAGEAGTNSNGVTLDTAVIDTDGGNIVIRGQSALTETAISNTSEGAVHNADGVRLYGVNNIDAGSGTLSITGVAQGTGSSNGIELSQSDTSTLQSGNGTANAIVLNGQSTNASASDGYGIFTWANDILATNGGGITLTGTAAKNGGVVVYSNSRLLANSGKITLTGTGGGTSGLDAGVVVYGSTVGQADGSAITDSNSDIEINADTLTLTGTLQSSGALAIRPITNTTTVGLAGAPGTLALTADNFSTNIVAGFDSITVGRSTGTGKITVDALTVNDDLHLISTSGGIEFASGALDAKGNVTATALNGNITVDSAAAIEKTAGGTATLTLAADQNVIVDGTISGSAGHALNVVLASRASAGNTESITGEVVMAPGSAIHSYGGDITIGGGDANASGYAIAGTVAVYGGTQVAGVQILGNDANSMAVVNATNDGGGTADATMPAETAGGDITIRGKGNTTATPEFDIGVWAKWGTIITGGSGNITITGYGGSGAVNGRGNGDWGIASAGVVLESDAYIKSNTGNVTIKGYAGTGGAAYGIVSTETSKMIGTNGELLFDGDSLMIRNGTLTVYAGQNSDIKTPIVSCTDTAWSCQANIGFVKQGSGVLNLWGDAEGWSSAPPPHTDSSSTLGVFTDASNTVNLVNLDADHALYAFVTRPATANTVTSSTAGTTTLDYVLSNLTYTYNGTAYTLGSLWSSSDLFGASYGSLVLGTDYQFMYNGSAVTGFTNAGTYGSITVSLLNSSYSLGVSNTAGSLIINKAPLTITAGSASATYSGTAYAGSPSVSYSGFVNNETTSVLGGTLGYTYSSSNPTNAGTYTITPGGLTSSNYDIAYAAGTLTIDPRPITVTADSLSKTYGNADPTLTYQITSGSLVGSDALSGALTRAAGENVGSYVVNASALANGNYLVTASNGTLTINPRPITVTADALSKTYGNADPTLTYQITSGSLVGSDTLSGALTRAAGENVGSYVVNASALANGNYLVTANNGTLTIDPRPITVTADALSKTYGNADPTLTYQITSGSLVGSDTLSGALTRAAGENVGSYVVNASALANGNYLVTANNGTLTIDPRPITVTADSLSKTYGNADPALTYQITSGSLVGSDALSGALTRAAGENVGSYVVNASALANGNYLVTASNGTLTINPRPITVTIDDQNKVAGSVDPALTYQITNGNLVGSDALSGSLSRAPGESVGDYTITGRGLANGNYLLTVIDGRFTITANLVADTAVAGAQTAAATASAASSQSPATASQPSPNTGTSATGITQASLSAPPVLVPTSQGSLPVTNLSGGLAFVSVPQPQTAGGSSGEGGASGSAGGSTGGMSTASSPSAPSVNDLSSLSRISGFMAVFVVNGGVNLGVNHP